MANVNYKKTRRLSGTERGAIELLLRYVTMILLLVIFVGPFIWMLSLSFRGAGNIYSMELIPDQPTFANFTEAWEGFNLSTSFFNSVIVSILSVISNILFCSLAAYPLARMNFPGKKIVFLLILSTLMIPFQLYMIPLFVLSVKLNLFNTLIGIVLPTSVGAFGIFLVRQFYQTIPMDLEEAARIDGANEFQIWALIMFPLTKPVVAALGIFVFVFSWSNFLWPLIVIDSESLYTLPISISKMSGAFVDKTQTLAAGSVIAVLPIVVMFFFLQRFFIGGMTLGSVKG